MFLADDTLILLLCVILIVLPAYVNEKVFKRSFPIILFSFQKICLQNASFFSLRYLNEDVKKIFRPCERQGHNCGLIVVPGQGYSDPRWTTGILSLEKYRRKS